MAHTFSNTAVVELTPSGARFVFRNTVVADLPNVHVQSDYEPTDEELKESLTKLLNAARALPIDVEYVIDHETLGHNGAVSRAVYISELMSLLEST